MRKIWTYLLLCLLLITPSLAQAQDEPYQEVFIIQQDERVTSVAWHPIENKLASASGSYIYIWSTETGELIDSFKAYEGSAVTAITWSPQGDRLASIGTDLPERYPQTVKIWGADTLKLLYTLDAAYVISVAWSPDGNHLVTVNDAELRLDDPIYVFSVWSSSYETFGGPSVFHLSTGLPSRPYSNGPTTAVWMSTEEFIGVNGYGNISIWDISVSWPVDVFSEWLGYPSYTTDSININFTQAVSWNSSRNLLAVTSNDNYTQSFQINVINPSTRDYFQVLRENPASGTTVVAWSPTGDKLASGDGDGLIQIWDADTFETLGILHQEDLEVSTEWSYEDVVTSISWSPDGAYLASGSGAGVVRIWDVSP